MLLFSFLMVFFCLFYIIMDAGVSYLFKKVVYVVLITFIFYFHHIKGLKMMTMTSVQIP